MRIRPWVLLAALPVLLLAGDFLYWRLTVRQLETGFQTWVADRREAGWTVRTGAVVSGGWPSAATLTVSDLNVEGGEPDIPGGVAWDAGRVVLRVALLRPRTLEVTAAGAQHLRLGAGPAVAYSADSLQAVLPLEPDAPPRAVDIQARTLRIGLPGGDAADGARIGIVQGHLDFPAPAQQGADGLGFALSADAITLPATIRWPLGPLISAFTVEGTLRGPLTGASGLTARATAWRDGGGSLEIQRLTLGWGPLGLSATATLALDDQLQPMGAGNSRLVGYAATLDALAANGVLSRSAATAAKAVLSLLAGTPSEGEPSAVDVPLTLQYRTLSMRQVPLLRLPELDWPQP